jgi:hypothetical protein
LAVEVDIAGEGALASGVGVEGLEDKLGGLEGITAPDDVTNGEGDVVALAAEAADAAGDLDFAILRALRTGQAGAVPTVFENAVGDVDIAGAE